MGYIWNRKHHWARRPNRQVPTTRSQEMKQGGEPVHFCITCRTYSGSLSCKDSLELSWNMLVHPVMRQIFAKATFILDCVIKILLKYFEINLQLSFSVHFAGLWYFIHSDVRQDINDSDVISDLLSPAPCSFCPPPPMEYFTRKKQKQNNLDHHLLLIKSRTHTYRDKDKHIEENKYCIQFENGW